MPAVLLTVLLAAAARANMCTEPKSCIEPQPPQACMPGPKGGQCNDLPPDLVKRIFEGAMKKHGLDPVPLIVLAPDQEFVTFDCAAGQAKAGGSNAETNQCGDRNVVTVGRSVVDMSINCPDLDVKPADALEAWALHEGAHVKLKHVSCRRLEIQRICTAWANEPAGRNTVTRLLRVQGAIAVDQLPPEGVARFRNEFVSSCVKAKRDQFNADARDQEEQADVEAEKLAKPRALECALHGAISYLKTIGAQEDDQHTKAPERLLRREADAAAQAPQFQAPSIDAGALTSH